MEKVEKLIKLFPVFAMLLIFFGFANLYYFYSHFGINIYSYLNSSEIIFSFLPDLQITFFWIVLIIIFIVVYGTVFTHARPVNLVTNEDVKNEEEEEVHKKKLSYNLLLLTSWSNFKSLTWKERFNVLKNILT